MKRVLMPSVCLYIFIHVVSLLVLARYKKKRNILQLKTCKQFYPSFKTFLKSLPARGQITLTYFQFCQSDNVKNFC